MAHYIHSNLPSGFQHLIADLHASYSYEPPQCIIIGDLRPDVIFWSEAQKLVVLIELTVCFDTLYASAHQRKKAKYTELLEYPKSIGYQCKLITIEIGSRGFIPSNTVQSIFSVLQTDKKATKALLRDLVRIAITKSHKIWRLRNTSL